MALKLAGEEIGNQEKIETLYYAPGLQDTGDLEAATKTITATSEASGVGNADYSHAITLSKPSDARLTVKRVAARLAVTIDSMTAGHLYCRVYVDAQDAAHRLFDEDWTGIGAKLDAVDKTSGTLFDLMTDGAQHTFYFFFWVDSGNAVLSVVQLWECVSTCTTGWAEILRLDHQGLISFDIYAYKLGTGTAEFRLTSAVTGNPVTNIIWTGSGVGVGCPLALVNIGSLRANGTVATDLNLVDNVTVILRSEQ